jgi:hypothetical protein
MSEQDALSAELTNLMRKNGSPSGLAVSQDATGRLGDTIISQLSDISADGRVSQMKCHAFCRCQGH